MKKICKIVILILVTAVLLLAAAYGWVQTNSGKTWIASYLSQQLSDAHQRVSIQGLDGHLPWQPVVDKITVADKEGVWLEVDQVALAWQPLALLADAIHIDSLTASSIHMHRTPTAPVEAKIERETFSLQNLSLPAISIAKVDIPSVHLPAELTGGEATRWQIQLSSDAQKDIGFKGNINTTEGPETLIQFSASVNNVVDIALDINEAKGGLLARLAGLDTNQPLISKINAAGTPQVFEATAKVTSGEVQVLNVTVKKAEQFALSGAGTIPPELNKRLGLPEDSWQLTAHATEDDNVWKLSNTVLTLGNATLNASGAFDADKEAFDGMLLELNITELAPWSVAAGQQLSGRVQANMELSGTLQETAYTLQSDSNINGQPFTLRGEGKALDMNEITMDRLNITTPELTAQGNASYVLDTQAVKADLKLSGLSLGALTQGQLRGKVAGTVVLDGTLDALPMKINGHVNGLAGLPDPAQSWVSSEADITMDATYAPELITISKLQIQSGKLTLNAKGDVPFYASDNPSALELELNHSSFEPILAKANMQLSPKAVMLDNLSVRTQGSEVKGALSYGIESALVDAELNVNSQDIGPASAWLGLGQTSGALDAQVTLASALGAQSASIKADMKDVYIPSTELKLKALTANASTSDIATLAALELDMHARNATIAELTVTALDVKANSSAGRSQASTLTASLVGAYQQQELKLNTEASIDLTGAEQSVKLTKLEGNYATLPLRLQRAAMISINGDKVTLSPLELRVAEGKLVAEGTKTASTISASAKLSDMPLEPLLADVTSMVPNGTVTADLKLSGAAAKPIADLAAKLVLKASAEKQADTVVDLNTRWNNNVANPVIENNLTIASSKPLGEGKLSIPASLSLQPFALNIRSQQAMNGMVAMAIPLVELNPMLAPYGHELAGLMKVDATIGGTLDAPKTDGTLVWENGTYDHLTYGACLRNIDMRAQFNPESLTISKLQATGDRNAGTVNGSGTIQFADQQINTAIDMEKLNVFCHGMAKGQVAGNIAVKGTLDDVSATGKLLLGPMTVMLPTGSETYIPDIDTVYKSQLNKAERKAGVIHLGIDVEVSEPVFVRGRGVDAQFEGALRVEGTAAKPELDGKLTSKRGQIEVLGSTLNLTKGSIHFVERNPANPYLDMEATTQAGDVDINVNLSGSAKKPELSLSSSPQRPQDEVLALLLFGRPLQNITPFQALQLAQAAATLAGKSTGPSVLGLARDALGVDTLSINRDEDGGATVGAGKYVTDRVFVGVEQGTTPESRKVKTEIELTPNITAETTAGATGGPSVGVEWRYDY